MNDHTGKRFGMLVAIERIPRYYRNITGYKCVCDCGNECIKLSNSLATGTTKSCGCQMNKRKINPFKLENNLAYIFLKNNYVCIIDADNYDKIKNYYWSYDGNNYVYSKIQENGKNLKIYLHRLLMNVTNTKKIIDHIDGNPLNNQKLNLRIVDDFQNAWNHKTHKINLSGVTGVRKASNTTWHAFITANKKQINLGRYKTFEEAVKARKDAEIKYFGEYRRKDGNR